MAVITRVRIACIALAHIPLAAIVTLVLSDGAEGDWPIILTSFGATVLTAVTLFVYLGRSLGPERRRGGGVPSSAAR